MSFPCSCHAAKEHCKWAHFQERLLEKVQHNREENEGSHPCDCQPTAEAGSSGSKSLTRQSISALNDYASRSRLASSVERLLAVTLRVTLCHSKRQAQSNRLSARLSWLQTHSHVCVSLRSLPVYWQSSSAVSVWCADCPQRPGAASENLRNASELSLHSRLPLWHMRERTPEQDPITLHHALSAGLLRQSAMYGQQPGC